MIRNSQMSPFPGEVPSLLCVYFIWINAEMILNMQLFHVCIVFHHDKGKNIFYTDKTDVVFLVQCGC